MTEETTEAAEALVAVWSHAAQAVSPYLSAPQLQALLIARRRPSINLRGLAEAVGAAPSAVSRLCDRLEAAGFLRREAAPTSRREIGLVLTPRGHEMIDTLFARRAELFDHVMTHMPADSRQELLRGLRAFSAAARRSDTNGAEHP
ncbi:MarR family winged helix-turn-helix transcriptional regulator [Streptomyces sp. NPDC058644]|uniref:MarR family winged helix-turn-helix transcriptional regulator n=1 Tax=unclassified Streptomyces TaxID=2593676 RepID=UPI003664CA78